MPDWIIPTFVGCFLTFVITCLGFIVRNRRALLTYHVTHERIGVSASDNIHDEISVTVGGVQMQNLYMSNIWLVNRSIRDIEKFEIKVYVGDHIQLITEQTHIEGTVESLKHTENYEKTIKEILLNALASKEQVKSEEEFTTVNEAVNQAWQKWNTRRDYNVPVLTRGQTIRLTYMINVLPNVNPGIFISCQKVGVRLEYKQPYQPVWHLWGVPLKEAGISGIVIGILVFFITISTISTLWLAALLCLIMGALAQAPGAALIKLYWWLRNRLIG